MNIPTRDPLKPKPRIGTPQRSQSETKVVEGTTNAALIRSISVSTTPPAHGQALVYNSAAAQYIPGTVAGSSSVEGGQIILSDMELVFGGAGSGTATIRRGNTNIGLGSSGNGIITFSPGATQRMEILATPRVGSSATYADFPTLTFVVSSTDTTFTYTCATDPILAGHHVLIDSEAILVQSVNTGANTFVGVRGRLNTTAAGHFGSASIRFVNVVSVVEVQGGLRATGGVAMTDLALHGYSVNEFVLRATFTEPIATYVGNPDGAMHLQRADHGHAADTNYAVEIDSGGSTGFSTFRWSDDGGATWIATGVPTSSSHTHLANGVYISWDYGTYMVGTRWDWTAIGSANQTELLRADTAGNAIYIGSASGSVLLDGAVSVGSALDVYGLLQVAGGIAFNTATPGNQVIKNFSTTDIVRFPDSTEFRVLVPMSVGANAAPAAGLTLDVTGDAAVSSQLHVGAVTVPAAGVALQLTGGRIQMSATPSNYIQDSAGLRMLTFASDTNATATTLSVAGDLRVNDQLGVGGAVAANVRAIVLTWVNLGAGISTQLAASVTGLQSANATTRKGFSFTGSYNLNDKTLTDFRGLEVAPILTGTGNTDALTNYTPIYVKANAQGMLSIVNSDNIFIDAPDALHGQDATPVAVTTLHTGMRVANQGVPGALITAGLDIETQSGAATESIGLRLNANFWEGTEMTAPAAPAANNYRVWGEDDGAGKTRYMIEFSSGGPIQLAIQP